MVKEIVPRHISKFATAFELQHFETLVFIGFLTCAKDARRLTRKTQNMGSCFQYCALTGLTPMPEWRCFYSPRAKQAIQTLSSVVHRHSHGPWRSETVNVNCITTVSVHEGPGERRCVAGERVQTARFARGGQGLLRSLPTRASRWARSIFQRSSGVEIGTFNTK